MSPASGGTMLTVMNRCKVAAPTLLTVALLIAAPTATAHASDSSSSRGSQIVWVNAASGADVGHLLIARPDGSAQRVLTPQSDSLGDQDPDISPNGRTVLFTRYDNNNGGLAEVRVVPSAGGQSRALDLGCSAPCLDDERATWLTQERIAWTRYVLGNQYPQGIAAILYSAKLDDGHVSDVRRLSPDGPDGQFEDSYARPTPDGRYYVFERANIATGDGAVFRMNRDRTHLQQLVPWELTADLPRISPATSGPTAGLVVFQTFGKGNPTGTSRDLATVPVSCASLDACSRAISYVTSNGMGTGRASNPAWSPDGRRIAYAGRPSIDTNDAQILTIAYDGSDPRLVSTSPLFDYRPDWGRAPSGDATLGE